MRRTDGQFADWLRRRRWRRGRRRPVPDNYHNERAAGRNGVPGERCREVQRSDAFGDNDSGGGRWSADHGRSLGWAGYICLPAESNRRASHSGRALLRRRQQSSFRLWPADGGGYRKHDDRSKRNERNHCRARNVADYSKLIKIFNAGDVISGLNSQGTSKPFAPPMHPLVVSNKHEPLSW